MPAEQYYQEQNIDENPLKTTVDKNPKISNWKKTYYALLGATAMGIGTIGTGTYLMINFFEQQHQIVQDLSRKTNQAIDKTDQSVKDMEDLLGKSFQRPIDPNILNKVNNEDTTPINLSFEFRSFETKRYHLNDTFYELTVRPNTEPAIETLQQIATEHVLKGMNTVNETKNAAVFEYLEETDGLKVKTDNRVFDLKNPLDFQIVYGLTYFRLERLDLEEQSRKTEEYGFEIIIDGESSKDTSQKAILINELNENALLWLKDSNIPVNFSQNSLLLADQESLANFAKTLKLTQNLGFPPPRINLLGANPKYGGIYLPHGFTSRESIIDYSDKYGSVDSLTHELGHYISHTADDFNPKLSLKSFTETMEATERENPTNTKDKSLLFFYLLDEQRNAAINNKGEEYAYFFSKYLTSGIGLKGSIESIKEQNPHIAAIMQAQYDFFKNTLGEFSHGVLTKEDLASQN